MPPAIPNHHSNFLGHPLSLQGHQAEQGSIIWAIERRFPKDQSPFFVIGRHVTSHLQASVSQSLKREVRGSVFSLLVLGGVTPRGENHPQGLSPPDINEKGPESMGF